MSPLLGVFIMVNNYFHDVATALLLSSGVVMWIVVKRFGGRTEEAVTNYFIDVYHGITRLAKFSLYLILVTGIPRTLAYRKFEWTNAVEKEQMPALIIKHVIAFILVGSGVYVWLKLSRKVKALKEESKKNA